MMKHKDEFTVNIPSSPGLSMKLNDILDGLPGGLSIYHVHKGKILPVFRNPTYYQVMGYSKEHIAAIQQGETFIGVHPDDLIPLQEKTAELLQHGKDLVHIFRVFHDQNKCYHWFRLTGSRQCLEDGSMLFYAIYTDVTDLKETQLEMNHLINSGSGGVACYRVEQGHFIPTFCSDGVSALSGYTPREFMELYHNNMLRITYDGDIERVMNAALEAVHTGGILNISYRIRCKSGLLTWIHLSGQRIGPLTESSKFYASFSGISDESRMYLEIANEAADAIYVIDQENHEILYFHESNVMFPKNQNCIGHKCYEVLQQLEEPCSFCNFRKGTAGQDTEVFSEWNGRVYRLHVRETVWNGIPAFIQYLRDVTEEVQIRQEKQRLEQYFQTLVEKIPGGVVVIRRQKDGTYIPEFISSGFADMTATTIEQAKEIYGQDALSGVHPDDVPQLTEQLYEAFTHTDRRYELIYRLKKGSGGYIWVQNTLSMLPSEGGDLRQYCYLRDITAERREQEHLRKQYQKLIVQHYRTPGPNTLALGHCNITKDKIIEVNDYTGFNFFKTLGSRREDFFYSLSDLIAGPEDRHKFLELFLNEPMLKAYERKETEKIFCSFIRLPNEETGRYVQCKINLAEEPDSGDVTGILSVTDVTEQRISSQVLEKLSSTGYDHIIILDLPQKCYSVFASNPGLCCIPENKGNHSEWTSYMLNSRVLPKDSKAYRTHLDPDYITEHLKENSSYSFDFSITDDAGNIRIKRMTVFDIDLRIGRVGISRTDVTETIREQQSLLNMLAYTFELAAFIDIKTGRMIMHTRQTVLEDLPAFIMDDYDAQIRSGLTAYETAGQSLEDIRHNFILDTMLTKLKDHPLGYDFVCAYQDKDELRYKKINVLWGDRNCQTVCIVRADVTEMLAEERRHKSELETALSLANEANQAKSDFFSAMSHDIRTPMNAIMGMTELAIARPDDSHYVRECLRKVSISSKHLLNLINDVLDMSKIEHAKIELNRDYIFLPNLVEQISTMVRPQANEKKQNFRVTVGKISHNSFYGDALRLNQILINILGNAVKFTPEKGSVDFQVEELPAAENCVKYAFSVRDTGIGMSAEMLEHIFEPFTRSSHVSRVEGTGLGLNITKGLIDRMGGKISIKSREGSGSLFYVELEFEAAQKEQSISPSDPPSISASANSGFLAGRRFLIAEDNEINSEILQGFLEMYGASSDVRTDGAQVVQEFYSAPSGTYDAILMDIQMPVMNGYNAAKSIRALPYKEALNIPIIAMTANAFAEDVQAAMNAGMNAHVAKPIDMDILMTTLRNVMN